MGDRTDRSAGGSRRGSASASRPPSVSGSVAGAGAGSGSGSGAGASSEAAAKEAKAADILTLFSPVSEDERPTTAARRGQLARRRGKWAGHAKLEPEPPPPVVHIIEEALAWHLAVLVPVGSDGLPSSFGEALDMYEAMARDGDQDCNAGMGTLTMFGWGVPQDYRRAKEYFLAAADRAHARGQSGMGILLANGWGVEPDYTEAFRWLHMGAAQGDPLAKHELGRMYWLKRGTSLDYRKAVHWFDEGAKLGYALSQFQLGEVYQHGTMVHPQQLEKSLRWFRMASQQGYSLADPAIEWVKERLWSPDIEGQLRRARARAYELEEELKEAEERCTKQRHRAEKAEANVERLEQRLLVELEIQRDLKKQLSHTRKLLERESQRAMIAEQELATKKNELGVTKGLLADARQKILALKDRVEFLLAELRRRQHFHIDVGGKWEGAWVPRGWEGDWKPEGGTAPAEFIGRWTCCNCTNEHSYYCKPFCGCGDITHRFCLKQPTSTGVSM